MTNNNLLDKCLAIIHSIKDDSKNLETLLEFMENEFVKETQDFTPLTDCKLQIDAKYRPMVKEIAEYLEMGHIVFVNPKTLKIDSVPKNYDSFATGYKFNYKKVQDWIEIEPLESHESYEIMESFVKNLPVGKEKEKLANAIEGHKPFANFNHLIHNSGERENWFNYRTCWFEKYVIDNYLNEIIEENNNKHLN